ncbi:MAG: response regulator [Treponema sp.]|nr:response regulator [Treponema sp.]
MDEEKQKQTIAIVDDSMVSLKAGKIILKEKYQVFAVPSGEKLFELLDNIKLNLILLDVEMPGMNGYEVIKRLKSEERSKNIPVVFLTSRDDPESELQGLNLGAIDYMQKPFSAPLLLKRIETHLLMISQAEEVQRAREQAEAASRAKSTFLAQMSHEIRTPLNAIIGMSELMRVDNLDDVQKGYVSDIQDMSKSLLYIINDVLDMSKIEAGKMDIVPVHFHLEEIFSHLCSTYHYLARNKDLEFRSWLDPQLPEIIFADEIRIRQIVTNIMGNAVKYTRQGFVELRMGMAELNNENWLTIAAIDSGIGIKEEDRQHIFDSFQQVDQARNRHIQGTGLGLAITLKLVQLMSGTIDFESEYGKGTTFTVYLPLVAGDPKKAEGRINFERVMATENIPLLVVDDNPVNLTVALGFLATHNIKAETASSGMEALQKIQERTSAGSPYVFVFMDHMMPEMDGLETTKRIRAWEQKTGRTPLPIVALSASAVAGVDTLFFEAGMNDFISKPIIANQLNRVLGKWLPQDKISIGAAEAPSAAATKDDPIIRELSRIDGLDAGAGLTNSGQNSGTYVQVLRQFSDGGDSYLEELNAALSAESWGDYCIKAHALKGVLASIGMEKLSKRAARLEKASNNSAGEFSPSLCKEETASFCAALSEFLTLLRRTSLFNSTAENKERPAGNKQFLKEQKELLKKACELCSAEEAEKIAAALGEFSWGGETQAALEKIRRFAASYDFDKVLEIIDNLQ